MVSIISYMLSLVKDSSSPRFIHKLGIPFPSVMHEVLDETFVNNFQEVFVIGDIHGCHTELVDLLQQADANRREVLKIFVGDLVNKGVENLETLALIQKMESALAVRGNHDEVVLKVIHDFKTTGKKIASANQWMSNLSKDNLDYLSNLPYTISIPSLPAVIVHAGLVPGVPLQNIHPSHLVSMRNLVFGEYFWEGGLQATKSDSDGSPWASVWPGPNHVYFGHDAKRMLQTYPYATGLDTGCVYGKMLTGIFIMGPRKGNIVQVKARRVYQTPGRRE